MLVQEDEKHQRPIYYISKVMQGAEVRYQMIEKLSLALVIAAWWLQPYFQSDLVVVRSGYPIKQVLRKPELAGRMIAWTIELSECGLRYKPEVI